MWLCVGALQGSPHVRLVGVVLVQVALQRAEVTAAVHAALLVGHGDAQVHAAVAATGAHGRRRALEERARWVRMLRRRGWQRARDGGGRGRAAGRVAWGTLLGGLLLGRAGADGAGGQGQGGVPALLLPMLGATPLARTINVLLFLTIPLSVFSHPPFF